MTYEEILDTKVIFGTAESVTEKLAQFKETLGLSAFTAELNPGGQLPKEAESATDPHSPCDREAVWIVEVHYRTY